MKRVYYGLLPIIIVIALGSPIWVEIFIDWMPSALSSFTSRSDAALTCSSESGQTEMVIPSMWMGISGKISSPTLQPATTNASAICLARIATSPLLSTFLIVIEVPVNRRRLSENVNSSERYLGRNFSSIVDTACCASATLLLVSSCSISEAHFVEKRKTKTDPVPTNAENNAISLNPKYPAIAAITPAATPTHIAREETVFQNTEDCIRLCLPGWAIKLSLIYLVSLGVVWIILEVREHLKMKNKVSLLRDCSKTRSEERPKKM
jgi:hypothetical protein